jgi:hypothetical protein
VPAAREIRSLAVEKNTSLQGVRKALRRKSFPSQKGMRSFAALTAARVHTRSFALNSF